MQTVPQARAFKNEDFTMKFRYTWTHSRRNIRTRYYGSELAARTAIARHIGWFELGAQPETGKVSLQKGHHGP